MANINDQVRVRNNFKKACMLVVEDNDDHWTLILRAMGEMLPEVKLVRADSQQQAQKLLTEWTQDGWEMPKLVLLDLYLPEPEKGWQVLTAVQSLPFPYNLLPVVILSSSTDQDDISEAYRRGGSSYLVKPTSFTDWLDYFKQLRMYWWETVTLPVIQPTFF